MQYGKPLMLIVCLFFSALLCGQQYPFVHYTSKDGLVNGRVRKAYQDSKGRMYFLTYGGLSVYDGTKFKNYTVQDGLAADLVNDVLEAADDSLWIACNTGKLNYLRKGEIRTFITADGFCPTINKLIKTKDGAVYAVADEGLFLFQQDRFVRLPFTDSLGRDAGKFLSNVVEWKQFLIIQPDPIFNRLVSANLYLYDKAGRRIVAEEHKKNISAICITGYNTIYISGKEEVVQLDTIALLNNRLRYLPLPDEHRITTAGAGYIYFDKQKNFWLFYDLKKIIKIDPAGLRKEFSIDNGLSSNNFTWLFQDREGIIWITMNGTGVDKLVSGDIELYDRFNGVQVNNLYINGLTDSVYMYSDPGKKIITVYQNSVTERTYPGERILPKEFIAGNGKIYLSDGNDLFLFRPNNSHQHLTKKLLYKKTVESGFGNSFIDPYKNLLISSNSFLTAVVADTFIFRYPVNDYIDQLAFDKKNRLWAASRSGELYIFKINPGQRENYLELLNRYRYDTVYSGLTARSLTADHFNNIWMGTRYNGLFCFQFDEKLAVRSFQQYTIKEGLSDNFVTHLTCDNDNNIWASTASGVDKIHIAGNRVYIENITRSSHIYKYIQKTFVTRAGVAWSHTADGNIIRIDKGNVLSPLPPTLFFTGIKTGDTIINDFSSPAAFNYRQNTFTVSIAAPSFYDEKQVRYSYWLQGSGSHHWSEPSNNSTFNFISLNPGKYNLKIKALFPGDRYPEQPIEYAFIIHPPWWQTWWFRLGIGILGIGILVAAFRFYYSQKLEKQKAIIEKQQAIEKERTRIATDMHDDLGAGLSRIKFLSETIGIKKQQQQPIDEDIVSIREYSHEMIDKMGEIVWALNEKNDSLSDLLSYTRSYAVEYLSQNGIACKVSIPENVAEHYVTGEFRRNIYLSVKEALHNIVKHAQARQVLITIETGKNISISIYDDGIGFTGSYNPHSNGLRNMKLRMKNISGTFDIENNNGTTVKLSAPVMP